MKIGIHHTEGTFSERWISYCDENNIEYKLVDCYKNDIINQLSDCVALMWHFNHKGAKESKFAKQLVFSLEAAGKRVFPNYNTVWHFDDKLGQKYLLESINAPLVPAYVFYSKGEAKKWLYNAALPVVFKLRNGSGSENVKLVKKKRYGYKLIRISFSRGFKHYEGWSNLKERIRLLRIGKTSLWNVVKGIIRLIYTTEYARMTGREKGYVYFQEFIPGNDFDIRVVVIGNKAFALKRMIRKNDFRASGSGFILYEKKHFDEATVRTAFEVADKLKAQCIAYDFIFSEGRPMIVEISYGFSPGAYDYCTGYWERNLTWHEGKFNPYGWMVEKIM